MSGEIDIPITLKAGVVHTAGRIRYRVVAHVYGQKPRFKYVGPPLRHKWAWNRKGTAEFCDVCHQFRRGYGNGPCRGLDKWETASAPLSPSLERAAKEARSRNAKRLASIPTIGRPEKRQSTPAITPPTEHQDQAAFFSWARPYLRTKGIDPRLCYAVPNRQIIMGGARNKHAVMAYLRAEGFTDGIPDIHLDVPIWREETGAKGQQFMVTMFTGLRIELKRKGGKPSTDQLEIADLMRRQGFNVVIAIGLDEAVRALKEYVERV